MEIKTAVVLAGGRGERLRPLTDTTPKPLLKIQGKPILEWQIEMLKSNGISEIFISVGHLAEKIKEEIGDGSRWGVKVKYIVEEEPLGTGGTLRILKDSGQLPGETFIYMNGDEMKDMKLNDFIGFHRDSRALCTIALKEVDDVSQFGVVKINSGRIEKFVEKPKKEEAPSNMINSGFYILEPEAADFVPEGNASIEKDVFPKIAEIGRLYGKRFDNQWFPTDTPERIENAEKNWKGFQ